MGYFKFRYLKVTLRIPIRVTAMVPIQVFRVWGVALVFRVAGCELVFNFKGPFFL